jgi:hypothetical protein
MKKAVLIVLFSLPSFILSAQSEAILEFEKSIVNLGKINLNDTLHFELNYKNSGTKPLIISEVKSKCACTLIEFSGLPLLSGKKASLKIRLIANTTGKFYKEIYVYSNTEISPQIINLKGIVK